MIRGVRYRHTNLVARDWRALAQFYAEHFGCTPVPGERDLKGPDFERGTAVGGAHARGAHLRLPGTEATLEIFEYTPLADPGDRVVNRPGFAHIAFAVASVADARDEVLAGGGSAVGDVIETTIASGETITWCYVRDPEGNIVELQSGKL
jgi:catechol 2,3-dioxygenase-like lactoylglutathione lyase family enzyme